MPKGFPLSTCRGCQKPIADRSELSATGLCPDCGPRIHEEEVRQLLAKRGPHYEKWYESCRLVFEHRRLDSLLGTD